MVYPTSLRAPLAKRIEELSKTGYIQEPGHLPDAEAFQTLVDVAFHASFMAEEKRRPGFRLLFCSPEDLKTLRGT